MRQAPRVESGEEVLRRTAETLETRRRQLDEAEARLAEALGGYGQLVEKPEDIRPALERAFASGKPASM